LFPSAAFDSLFLPMFLTLSPARLMNFMMPFGTFAMVLTGSFTMFLRCGDRTLCGRSDGVFVFICS
jgi:hypothetical protein